VAREPFLVTIEIRFRTDEETEPLADRVRESVAMIVGRDNLEDFRVRAPSRRPNPARCDLVHGASRRDR
jgi:hypothetical protein